MNREEANHLYHRFVEHEKRKQQAIRMIQQARIQDEELEFQSHNKRVGKRACGHNPAKINNLYEDA